MRLISFLVIICLLLVSFVCVDNARAQSSFGVSGQLKPGDSALYNSIIMDCQSVKAKLIKIHENDGLIRVNSGQQYDLIATKLMARFNAKIAENRLKGGEMFNYAAEFDKHLVNFREQYRTYETDMVQLIKADCDAYPQNFYYMLESVRESRQKIHSEVVSLHNIALKYYNEVKKFSKNYKNNALRSDLNESKN